MPDMVSVSYLAKSILEGFWSAGLPLTNCHFLVEPATARKARDDGVAM